VIFTYGLHRPFTVHEFFLRAAFVRGHGWPLTFLPGTGVEDASISRDKDSRIRDYSARDDGSVLRLEPEGMSV
jgi:hypothetical protein